MHYWIHFLIFSAKFKELMRMNYYDIIVFVSILSFNDLWFRSNNRFASIEGFYFYRATLENEGLMEGEQTG